MVDYTKTDNTNSTGISEQGYSGSKLAGMLVIILFLIWFFNKMGIMGNL